MSDRDRQATRSGRVQQHDDAEKRLILCKYTATDYQLEWREYSARDPWSDMLPASPNSFVDPDGSTILETTLIRLSVIAFAHRLESFDGPERR